MREKAILQKDGNIEVSREDGSTFTLEPGGYSIIDGIEYQIYQRKSDNGPFSQLPEFETITNPDLIRCPPELVDILK